MNLKKLFKDLLFKLVGEIDFYPSLDEYRFIRKGNYGYFIIREDVFTKMQRKMIGLEENK